MSRPNMTGPKIVAPKARRPRPRPPAKPARVRPAGPDPSEVFTRYFVACAALVGRSPGRSREQLDREDALYAAARAELVALVPAGPAELEVLSDPAALIPWDKFTERAMIIDGHFITRVTMKDGVHLIVTHLDEILDLAGLRLVPK
jgi:hypothetical protein